MSCRNHQRLGRIFRAQPRAPLPTRDWRPQEQLGDSSAVGVVGVTSELIDSIIASLSEDERRLALAGADPPPADELALQRREQRFSKNAAAAPSPPQPTPTRTPPTSAVAQPPAAAIGGADAEALRRRTQRFLQPDDPQVLKLRETRFSGPRH